MTVNLTSLADSCCLYLKKKMIPTPNIKAKNMITNTTVPLSFSFLKFGFGDDPMILAWMVPLFNPITT